MSEKIWSYDFEKHKEIKAGTLLLSAPFSIDDYFSRSVVLICRHDHLGTHGLIINKVLEGLTLHSLVANFPIDFNAKVLFGGPVSKDYVQYVHNQGMLLQDSTKIADGVYWGGDFEQVKKHIRQGKIFPQHIRFFLGYAGWEPGQLEEELKQDSWIISQNANNALFYSNPLLLWSEILSNMGGVYRSMSNYPENPQLN
jgi:putative transcriptional regulator